MLLNEFLKEHRNVAEQQSTIAELKTTVAQQQKQIEALTATVQRVSEKIELNKTTPRLVADLGSRQAFTMILLSIVLGMLSMIAALVAACLWLVSAKVKTPQTFSIHVARAHGMMGEPLGADPLGGHTSVTRTAKIWLISQTRCNARVHSALGLRGQPSSQPHCRLAH
jgi:uncharacterized coiled-coil protein SlyX